MTKLSILCVAMLSCWLVLNMGCTRSQPVADDSAPVAPPAPVAETPAAAGDGSSETPATAASTEPIAPPEIIEVDAESLLAAQLPADQLAEGWVRLFDGQSMYGWFVVGNANWQIADGVISVSRGDRSFLCTTFQIPDYEFQVDFRCDPQTNSGIFLRTGPEPQNVALDCLELNIAPPDNPFPTGSFVERKKLEASELADFDPTEWHTYHVRLVGNNVQVKLDGKAILELDDFQSNPSGHISLQHNSGRVEFRNILMRPIDPSAFKLGEDWEEDWSLSAKEEGSFTAEVTDNGLKLSGGLGKLQTKREFDDFILQARYQLAQPEVNSGIFFRCIADAMLDGYECQVNHAVVDGDPLRPADAGAGAIFRRQAARIVVGDGTQPTYLTLLANGPQMVTWVNGLQVAEFYDDRQPDDNPRKGLRTQAGPLALQGHDPTTVATFESLKISEL